VFPRAVLSPVDKEEEEELVALVVGPLASRKLLTCLPCRTQLTAFAAFLRVARGNIAKLRQVQEEQQVELKGERNSPDTTWPIASGNEEVGSPRLEISVRDSPSPPITWSRDNTVTIVALEDSQAKEAAAREANRLRNVRYRERKRAKEAELRGYISCVAVQEEEPVETIDVTPDLSITMEEEEDEGDWGRQEAVSPPPCHLPPILVPTSTAACFPTSNPNLYAPDVDPEERRRRRNREASRRYRERARGDPELLRRMREQQNRRQKKYYARLKEKKQGQFQEGPDLDLEGAFPIRGGSFDSTPSSD